MTAQAMTSQQVKANLSAQGITVKQWAAKHGYDSQTVYKVLQGVRKCNYGRGHEIAVALGLKTKPQTDQ